MRYAAEDGLFFSRWLPDLAFGYGYPFFNYRAAISYYMGLGLYVTGLALPLALNLVYVIAFLASAVGAYLFGRDLFGAKAGIVVAVAYVYAPYPFLDALVRGNMPESVALALFPFILWSFRRLLLSGRSLYLILSAGLLGLLWLTHNISSLLFTPFLALYLLVVWLARRRRTHLTMALAGLSLGIVLTMFFWAPAILEKEEVQLHLSRTTRNNDYHYNFVNLAEILAAPEPADPAHLNPPLRVPLGLPLVLLALLGTVLPLWRWRPDNARPPDAALEIQERWFSVVFFALSAVAMLFMATRASDLIWDNVPLIPFVQFPWRLVGRAVLPLSLLAGALVPALSPSRDAAGGRVRAGWRAALGAQGLTVLFLVTLLTLSALPLTYPASGYCPTKAQPHILDLFAYERSTGLVGVDPEGSYFPVTVKQRPTGSTLEAQYAARLSEAASAANTPIARFDPAQIPEGGVLQRSEYAPNYARLELDVPSPFRASYQAFAFPGWRVSIDGHPSDITPSDPTGLITFEVPAGQHTVEIDWGSTPVRAGGTMMSLVGLAALAFVLYTAVQSRLRHRLQAKPASLDASNAHGVLSMDRAALAGPTSRLAWGDAALIGLAALLLLGFKQRLVDQTATPFRRSGLGVNGSLLDVDVSLNVRYADGIRLLGYDRSTTRMPADGTLRLAVYWTADTRPERSYRSTVALRGPDGQLWSAKTAFPRRGYSELPPSAAWGNGRYAVEGFDVEPLPGTPPGDYELLLIAFDRETLAPLNVLDDAGQVAGPDLVVGEVELTRPEGDINPLDASMQVRLNASLGPVTLSGVNLDREEAAPGDPILVTLFWQLANGQELNELHAQLALHDQQDTPVAAWEVPPVRADWPTTLWQDGDFWRGQHLLRLPGGLESGTYTWQLQLYEAGRSGSPLPGSPVELGTLRINAPQRLWEAPALQIPLEAQLGQRVTLLGANLEPASVMDRALQPPATLTVTLAWQAQAEMETGYHAFLHLLRPDGSLLVQSDGVPANWTRPTTGWAPGEIVLDQHVLQIPQGTPPGAYQLVTGLYDPGTRVRLPLPNGATAVPITPITIAEP
jgi:hypothetical protein